jgi:2,3-bisphosphoglycerate-independent phosphoglycerate mutase
MMKGVFVILDGVADEASRVLGGKTPLEAANTPNLDFLAAKSKINYCYTVREGVAPESSSAVVSLLGFDPEFSPRGPLEAQGIGIKIKPGDLVLRTNFATIDSLESGNILDPRAGRTLSTKEAKVLAREVNDKVKLPFKFEFIPTIQHRGVLIFKGGFSDNITNADPNYGNGFVNEKVNNKLVYSKPMDDEDGSKLSADLLNSFLRHSYEILDKHPINLSRSKKGLFSANFVLARDAGNEEVKFKKLKGKWMALGYMPLEKGIANAAKMDLYGFRYPKLRGLDVYKNIYEGLGLAIKYSIKMIKKNRKKYDYFYVHFKETDLPGHDGKPLDKVRMIEMIDKNFFGFLKRYIKNNKLIVTADHTTSCSKKVHTADPVPILIYPFDGKKGEGQRFTENWGKKGKKMLGRSVLDEGLFGK